MGVDAKRLTYFLYLILIKKLSMYTSNLHVFDRIIVHKFDTYVSDVRVMRVRQK